MMCAVLVLAREISFENGTIAFDVPESYSELSQQELDLKYPSKRAPRFVVGNEDRSVSIAYDYKESGVPPEAMADSELPNAQKFFSSVYNRAVPGIVWINNDIIEKAGKNGCFSNSHPVR